jgi:hypothetical protein
MRRNGREPFGSNPSESFNTNERASTEPEKLLQQVQEDEITATGNSRNGAFKLFKPFSRSALFKPLRAWRFKCSRFKVQAQRLFKVQWFKVQGEIGRGLRRFGNSRNVEGSEEMLSRETLTLRDKRSPAATVIVFLVTYGTLTRHEV